MVKDIRAGANSSSPLVLTNVNGVLYFLANNGINGNELWKSDGTAAGTVMVKDINIFSSSNSLGFTYLNGVVYFRADDGINGTELWKTDGTATGTVMVKDIYAGANHSYPSDLINVNGVLYFSANNAINGQELWKSDGTEAGTVLVKNIGAGASGSNPQFLTDVNGKLFFSATYIDNEFYTTGAELWTLGNCNVSNTVVSGTGKTNYFNSEVQTSPATLTCFCDVFNNYINAADAVGVNPISGAIDSKVWIEPSVHTYLGQPFVARHFEITPTTNAATATGNVTLYFTQQEFNDFNAHASSLLDLPTNDADAAGKANLRIGKYPGSSNDGSGFPGTYPAGATVIDPVDNDIVWNATLSRWEVSFDVTGFSGFIVQTNSAVLPLTLLEFNGRLQNNNAVLNWKTDNEQNSSHFEIERSLDGRNYSSIGNITAANIAGVHQYGFTDNNISALGVPVVYYRLKQ